MAVTTNASEAVKASTPEEKKPLESVANQKIAACRTWKSYIEIDVKEMYFFASPLRQRQITSMTAPSLARMLDAPELNTDQAFILCQDAITEVVQAFMPEAEPWCEAGPGMDLPPGVWDKVQKDAKAGDETIFAAMKASNLYPELPKAFNPDLMIGTAALWIHRPHPHLPVVCSAIPFRELEVDLGPYGEIDPRFAVRFTRNAYVRELLGDDIWGKMSSELKQLCDDKPTDRTELRWGFWRKWEDKSDTVWQHVVMVGNNLVHDAELKGEGSCPLLPMRFNPTADWPHGHGPLWQGLPTFRQIDELELMRMENSALSIKPPITFPDDSFVNVEQGVEEGMAYPIRPGTEGAVKPIYTPPPPEVANYQYQEKLHNLRKLFFVDHPEQTGDTPPTATQWMDELARAQRRIGTPGLSFWREGPAQIYLRFRHLLEVSGAVKPLKIDGRAVAILPRNPAQAAAEQQELVKTMQLLTYVMQTFPEEGKMFIDGNETIQAMIAKARTTLIKMRHPDKVQAMVKQMSQLIGDRPVPGATNQTIGPAA